MAAIISTRSAKNFENLLGKYSLIVRAIQILMGVAKRTAKKEVAMVPKIKASAPKFSSIGFHSFLKKKAQPKALIAGIAE